MLYRLQEILGLLATPFGRQRLHRAVRARMMRLARRMAIAHRRTLAKRTRVVAVVGSLGKTTTSVAVGAALDVPVRWRILDTRSRLAPAVLSIKPWQRHAVVEVGIGSGMIGNGRIVQPDVVVVTSIASEHNRSFGTLEAIRDEKAKILQELRPCGLLVLNGDDALVRSMAALSDAPVLTFGFREDNDIRASDVHLDWPYGTRLKVHVDGAIHELRVPLLGRVMVYPVLAAVAVAHAERRRLAEVFAALQQVSPPPGRLHPVQLPNRAWMIRDEFKSTLETIDAALDLLAEVPGRKVVVLGEISEPPGSQGPHYRRLGGRLASMVSRAIIVGGKRSFKSYAVGAARAGLPRSALIHVRDVRDAIEAARSEVRPGDVVLIKGRGNQRLDRVALALQGRTVGCEIEFCPLRMTVCETCSKLEVGWERRPGPAWIEMATRGIGHGMRSLSLGR